MKGSLLVPTLFVVAVASGQTRSTSPSGAQDAFGYRLEDSSSVFCGFQWVDIAGTGTPLAFAAPYGQAGDPPAEDDGGAVLSLPSPFVFYGNPYNQLVVSPNGYLAFAPSLSQEDGRDFSNDSIPAVPGVHFPSGSPTFSSPGRLLLFHDDLYLPAGAQVLSQHFSSCPRPSESLGVEPCTIVQWHGVRRVGTTEDLSFQAVLYHASYQTVFSYGQTGTAQGASASVGIQSPNARLGLAYSVNGQVPIVPNLAVCLFEPRFPPGGPAADLAATILLSGDSPEGLPFPLSFHVGNHGPSAASGIQANVTFPPGFSYLGDSCGGDLSDGHWNVGNLQPQQGAECTVNIQRNGGGTVAFNAAGFEADPQGANNSDNMYFPPSDDGDSVAREVEDSFPGGGFPPSAKGDGNGDGIPDSQQPHVATLPLAGGKGYLTAELIGGCGQLQGVQTLTEASLGSGDQDTQFDFPVGLLRVTLPCPQGQLKLWFHQLRSLPNTYRFRTEAFPAPWATFAGATRFRERGVWGWLLPLVDGGSGDRTGVDGSIVHLGGPANSSWRSR